jgi:DNA-binding beta-propeller fold protein YncE
MSLRAFLPILVALTLPRVFAQPEAATYPNPYRTIENWGKLPEGRVWGSTSAVAIDRDGKSIWVAERCGANTCATSDLPVVLKFDPSGKFLKSFGGGIFIFPHGIDVDKEGNVWVTDTLPTSRGGLVPGKGHIVVKFSPEGKILMTLGKAGEAGDAPDRFNQPSDVVVAPNGDIFVADGHGGNTNARVVKFSKEGKFIKTWGKKGTAPGEFDTPHAIALDSKGRVFVGDRANNRIQIFDQDGKFVDQWKQFGRPSGIFIDKNDVIYVADSESNTARNPGWKRGIRIGSAKDGSVKAFIPDPEPNPDKAATSAAEGVATDSAGHIFGAEVLTKGIKRYEKK